MEKPTPSMSTSTVEEQNELIKSIPLDVHVNHLLAVRHSLSKRSEPILLNVQARCGDTSLYAWYPSGGEDACTKVLNLLYVMLGNESQHENHRTLVDCFIGILLVTSKMDAARDAARTLLTECFGTHQLGTMKRVIRPVDLCERGSLEIDVYLLPQRLASYYWLGR